jgi:O-antigen ligase
MGFGLGTWATVYPAYAHYDDGTFVNQAHNDWVQWTAEGGIPMLLAMLWVAAAAVRPGLRHLWPLGIAAVFLHCLVDYPLQKPALEVVFFTLLGTMASAGRRIVRTRPAHEKLDQNPC